MAKRGRRETYIQLAVDAEFRRLTELQKENPSLVIMPKEMAATLNLPDTTVRRILRDRQLWTKAHHDAAKRETLRRINQAKAEAGYPSLQRQRQQGFPNLEKGRQRLAQIHRLGLEAEHGFHDSSVQAEAAGGA